MSPIPIPLMNRPVAFAGADRPAGIVCRGLWKQYHFAAHRPRKLKQAVVESLAGLARSIGCGGAKKPESETRWALRNFNLTVGPGEIVGVVGHNGAGKSTLLKILSRILRPTLGDVKIYGRLSAMIELGAGFHEDLTGKENVHLAGSLLGLSRRDIVKLYGEIVDFAELAEHMDTPLKYFSTGMQTRLGFSIATRVDPQILLIDEVLAVGDVKFQAKCVDTIRTFNHSGKAILFVSHDMATVRSLCHRVLWLKGGETLAQGDSNTVIDQYLEHYWPGCTRKSA